MLGLAEVFGQPDGAAPQAPGGSLYSYSFLAPIDQNEPPQLSKSLSRNSADKGSARSGWPCSASRKAGCSDIDAHIPLKRVQDSARVLRRLEGDVVERIYPGMGHTINDDEIGHVRAALVGILYPD